MTQHDERRFAENRVSADDHKRLKGYAIVFNSLSVDLGGFRELISADAVDRTLSEGMDVRALIDHDTSKILGRTRAGTLTLRKDAHGLKAVIEPDLDISYAADIVRAVDRGDVSGMSFRFRALDDEWDYERGPMPIRTVTDMKISEVSVVTFPAYEATDVNVALRSLDAYRKAHVRGNVGFLQRWHRNQLAK